MKAVGYIRVSTQEQASEGVSLDAQREKIKTYCQLRGLDLVGVMADPGVSASKKLESRSGGAEILRCLKQGKAQTVVAYKLDRLFRNAADCLTVVEQWHKRDVSLHLVDQGGQTVDTGSAMGKFFLTILAGCAEMERNLISERTVAALNHKRGKGERIGEIPYGKQAKHGMLEDNPAEQRAISRIVQLRTAGESLRNIAKRLSKEGFKPRGSKWHLTTVGRILATDGRVLATL
jgi:DNA invertase Pin-like site-specific DNA recombinase